MLRVGDEVEVCVIVICNTKCLLEGLAGVDGEPDVGNCGVDKGEDAATGKQTFCAFLVGKLDRLEADKEVPGNVGCEVEGDVVWNEARLVVATECERGIDLL